MGEDPVATEVFDVGLDLMGDDGVARGEELLFRIVRRGVFVLRPGGRTLVLRDAPANGREEIAVRIDAPPPLPVTNETARGAVTKLVPMGPGSYQVLLAGRPATMTLEVTAPREWNPR